jgi:nucleotide-binding universal stress UspA family protein
MPAQRPSAENATRRARPLNCKRILYATDFSAAAAAGLEVAVALARAAQAEVSVVHVLPDAMAVGGRGGGPDANGAVDEMSRTYLIESLGLCGQRARALGIPARDVLLRGDPAEEIVREALQVGAGLIVMGPHSRSAAGALGSVTEHVIKQAPCPVLVARSFPWRRGPRPLRVVCAVDLGETMPVTLQCALAVTEMLQADLLVLHVALAGRVEDAREAMDAALAAASPGGEGPQRRVATGAPSEEVLAAATLHEGESDLVVVGSHGGGVVERQFLGSTTLHLLRHSECSVLVVPARLSETRDGCPLRSPPDLGPTSVEPDGARLRSWRAPD